MRTLRNFIRTLAVQRLGSPADGGRIGVGLDAALRTHRARGAEGRPLTTRQPARDERPFTRA